MYVPAPAPTRTKDSDASSRIVSDELFAALFEADKALQTLPAAITSTPELQQFGAAIHSGRSNVRPMVERAGGVAIADKLMEASSMFRSTGHFRQCSLLERCAFAIAGWERRRHPRRR